MNKLVAALAAELTEAEGAACPGSAEVAAIARKILGELDAAQRCRQRAEQELGTAAVMMRAAVADARDGRRDPTSHLRRYLTPRGWMPRGPANSLVLLAWGPGGPPSRPGRDRGATCQAPASAARQHDCRDGTFRSA